MAFFGDSEGFLFMLQSTCTFPIPIDFSFIIGDKSYPIYKLFACMLSPAVLRALQSDATIEEYIIDYDGDKEIFVQILNIFSGKPFKITEENSFDVYKIASELQNEELIKLSTLTMFNVLTNFNIFQKFELARKLNITMAPFIEYIATNFQELSSNEALFDLSNDIIIEILKNPKLSIPNYQWLLKWIEDVIKQRGSQYCVLIESLKFSDMMPSDVYQILQMTTLANMTSEICFKIKSAFTDVFRSMILTVEYKNQDDSLRGIFNSLATKYGNVVERGLVNVIVPCNDSMANDLLNYTNKLNDHYINDCVRDHNWIIFDFQAFNIQLTAYTIRGCHCPDHNCRPKSWIISGSNDKKNWFNLSEIRECTSIDRPYGIMTFGIHNKIASFRFIKYTQIENNEKKKLHYTVHLSAIEFFGTLSSIVLNGNGS